MPDAEPPSKSSPNHRRTGRTRFVMAALAFVIPCLMLLWLFATEPGLSATARLAGTLSGGRIDVQGVKGRLIGPLQIGALRFGTPEARIRIRDLLLDWEPAAMLGLRLSVSRLHAASVDIATASSGEPAVIPRSLSLPLKLTVEQFEIGELTIGSLHPVPEGHDIVESTLVTIKALSARLQGGGDVHELSELSLTTSVGEVRAALRLGAEQPFPLQASATLVGTREGNDYRIQAKADGTLTAFKLDADASGFNLKGHGVIDVTPFASVPLARARVEAGEANPAAFRRDLPEAAISVKADLQPLEEPTAGRASPDQWAVSGPIQVTNRTPGRLDRNLLPVSDLKAWAKWSAQRLELTSIELALSGAGRLTGEARYAEERLEAELNVRDVNLAELQTKLKPTRLSGKIRAEATSAKQAIAAELRDPRFAVTLDARRTAERIDIQTARLQAGGASLDVTGGLSLSGDEPFELKGKLVRFDPGFYADLPRGELNARLDAIGMLKPRPSTKLSFALHDSHLDRHAVAGRGEVRLTPERLDQADIVLDLAGNQFEAQGAFGHPGDTLVLRLDAPKLDVLSGLTPWRLGGTLKGEAKLAGMPSEPSGQVDLTASNLLLPNALRLAYAKAHAELLEGVGSRFTLNLELAELRLPEREGIFMRNAQVEVQGTRADHRITGRSVLAHKEELVVEADGVLLHATQWDGRLTSFALRGDTPYAFSLVSPVSLKAGTQGVSLGTAELRGAEARVRLIETSWRPREIVSRGDFTRVGVGVALNAEREAATHTEALRLGGAWDIRLGEHVDGNFRLYRETGDFVLGGDPPVRFGLEALEIRASAVQDRLAGSIDVRGTKIGRIGGSATALATRTEEGWGLVPDAALAASVRAAVPSIEWVGPLIDPNLQLKGRLDADFALSGTPARPLSQGKVTADTLSIALADKGLRLSEGVLRADFTPDRLRLTELSFKSSSYTRPHDRRIDVSELTREPGNVTAAGDMLLSSGKGEFRFTAERFAVFQLPDRWLMVSGEGRVLTSWEELSLAGRVVADAGYWELAKSDAPRLGDDVVILGKGNGSASTPTRLFVDVEADLGRRFYLKGRGLDTRLSGGVRLRGEGRKALRASGSIRTREGTYDAYGQFLSIERGIINFQGPIDNPGLNVVALRKNLPVEAGVSITGTVQKPQVQLVSEPNVPDSEKLSWIVLGRAPDQSGGGDSRLLFAAANAMLGGESGGISRQLALGLGLDEITVGSADPYGDPSRAPTSTVAGGSAVSSGSNSVTSQVLTVGKRLSSAAYLSYEQGLGGAENVVKLTYHLSRRLSLIGRAGTQNAIDLLYTFSFN